MELCLVRHAIAAERGPAFPDDGRRPLTPEGRERFAQAARGLLTLFVPQVIFTSALVRARETAEILAEASGARTVELRALAEGDHAGTLLACAEVRAERVALVGHEPWMGELLALLLTGDADALRATFKKGAAALVSTYGPPAPSNATLQWLLQPAALRKLASR